MFLVIHEQDQGLVSHAFNAIMGWGHRNTTRTQRTQPLQAGGVISEIQQLEHLKIFTAKSGHVFEPYASFTLSCLTWALHLKHYLWRQQETVGRSMAKVAAHWSMCQI